MLRVAATDAVGMGLNLAIRRVVFSATDKFDGRRRRPLTVSEIKQIGGRAGRYGGDHAGEGVVTCLPGGDLLRIRRALSGVVATVRAGGLLPSTEQLEVFAAALLPAEQRHAALLLVRRRHLATVARGREAANQARGDAALAALFEPDDGEQTAGAAPQVDGPSGGIAAGATMLEEEAALAAELREELAGIDAAADATAEAVAARSKRKEEWGDMFSFDEEGESKAADTSCEMLGHHSVDEEEGGSEETDSEADLDSDNDLDSDADLDSDNALDSDDDLDSDNTLDSDDDLDIDDQLLGRKSRGDDADSPGGASPFSPEAAAASATSVLDAWIAAASGAQHDDGGRVAGGHTNSGSAIPFSRLLRLFEDHSTVDTARFFVCDQSDVIALAKSIDDVGPIVLRDRHALCCAPLDANSPLAKHAFHRWATAISRGRGASVGLRVPSHMPTTSAELRAVEDAHKVFDAYLWLARRMPSRFLGVEDCEERLEVTESMIADGLERMGLRGAAEARRAAFEEQRQLREAAARDAASGRAIATGDGAHTSLHERDARREALALAEAAGVAVGAGAASARHGTVEADKDRVAGMLRVALERLKGRNLQLLQGTVEVPPGAKRLRRKSKGAKGMGEGKTAQRLQVCGALLGPVEVGHLRSESKMLRRLTRRMARGKHLSRKERRAAAMLLQDSLTGKLASVALATSEEDQERAASRALERGAPVNLSLRHMARPSNRSAHELTSALLAEDPLLLPLPRKATRAPAGAPVWDQGESGSQPVQLAKTVISDLAAAMASPIADDGDSKGGASRV